MTNPDVEGLGDQEIGSAQSQPVTEHACEQAATADTAPSGAFKPIYPHRHHGRHPWAQPGDRPERVWLLRFDDADRRDMIWTGHNAEAEAKAAYQAFVPSWNVYLLAAVNAEEIP